MIIVWGLSPGRTAYSNVLYFSAPPNGSGGAAVQPVTTTPAGQTKRQKKRWHVLPNGVRVFATDESYTRLVNREVFATEPVKVEQPKPTLRVVENPEPVALLAKDAPQKATDAPAVSAAGGGAHLRATPPSAAGLQPDPEFWRRTAEAIEQREAQAKRERDEEAARQLADEIAEEDELIEFLESISGPEGVTVHTPMSDDELDALAVMGTFAPDDVAIEIDQLTLRRLLRAVAQRKRAA